MTLLLGPPPTTQEVLRTLESSDVNGVENVFDALWYELPDRFADDVLRMVRNLPHDVFDQHPRLAYLALLAQQRTCVSSGDDDGLDRTLRVSERVGLRYARRLRTFRAAPDLTAAGTAAVIALRRRRDHVTSSRVGTWTDARTAGSSPLSALPLPAVPVESRPGWLTVHRGITATLSAAVDDAIHLLTRAKGEAEGHERAHYAGLVAAAYLALISAFHGHHGASREHLAAVDGALPFPSWAATTTMGPEQIARSQLAIDEGEPATALRMLRALPAPAARSEELWAFHAYTRACYQALYGDPLDGLRELDETRSRHGATASQSTALAGRLVLKAEARLLLGAGGAARVLQLAHQQEDEAARWLAAHHAWAHLAVGENHEAIRLASTTLQHPELPPAEACELHAALAVAHLRTGRDDRARTWFQRALRLRAAPRHVAPFLAIQQQERETLTSLAGVPEILPGGTVKLANDVPAPSLSERLSRREHAVLEKLAAGHTAQSAADALNVSVNTVRTQIRNIYRKLGVCNRDDAITVAHELVLLVRD